MKILIEEKDELLSIREAYSPAFGSGCQTGELSHPLN